MYAIGAAKTRNKNNHIEGQIVEIGEAEPKSLPQQLLGEDPLLEKPLPKFGKARRQQARHILSNHQDIQIVQARVLVQIEEL